MDYPPILDEFRRQVEEALPKFLDRCGGPPLLAEAMRYSVLAGGKRLRPVLLLAARSAFGRCDLDPMPAACAMEFIHTYSLIHDDLPAMDNDDFRRGRPTSHRKFGEAVAILAGDALVTNAFGIMAAAWGAKPDPRGIRVIAEMASAAGAAGMVGGQTVDVLATGRPLDQDSLETMHRMKTGALIRASVRAGAILGGADDDELDSVTRFGEHVGLAFQVADDVLDAVGTDEALGKTAGKDAAQGKTTYVSLLGVEQARRYAVSLRDRAVSEISRFNGPGESLRAIADFSVRRAS